MCHPNLTSIRQKTGPRPGIILSLSPGAEYLVTADNVGVGGDTLSNAQHLDLATTLTQTSETLIEHCTSADWSWGDIGPSERRRPQPEMTPMLPKTSESWRRLDLASRMSLVSPMSGRHTGTMLASEEVTGVSSSRMARSEVSRQAEDVRNRRACQ